MPNNLGRQYSLYADEYRAKAMEVLDSGWYILGKEVAQFESEWANYVGSKYCVGLASGLDALWISFKLLGIGSGDEVIVCANALLLGNSVTLCSRSSNSASNSIAESITAFMLYSTTCSSKSVRTECREQPPSLL